MSLDRYEVRPIFEDLHSLGIRDFLIRGIPSDRLDGPLYDIEFRNECDYILYKLSGRWVNDRSLRLVLKEY